MQTARLWPARVIPHTWAMPSKTRPSHPSYLRLVDGYLERVPDAQGTPGAVAHLLGISPQSATNWQARGVSRDGALKAQRVLGVSAMWILHGTGARAVAHPPEDAGAQAQPMILDAYTVPVTVPPERWMTGDALPSSFVTTAPDDALAPSLPRGARVLMRALEPAERVRPGACVIVEDAQGRRYLRRYAETAGGGWSAQALHGAYATLQGDGLRVLAVMSAMFTDQIG